MLRIAIYILSILYRNIFIQSQGEKFDVQWDEMLRRNDENLKCGVQNKIKITPELTPRIINGRRTIHMMIPLLWVILPITRYLGIKKSAILFLGSPQLLMLPFITDFVFGPLNGYRRCNCCGSKCCCSIGCCFCWGCCCQTCKFEEGHEITISKEMSTIKMIYSFCILILFCIMTYFGHFGEGSSFHQLLITYFVLAGIGKICFITILYAGKDFHVLKIDNS